MRRIDALPAHYPGLAQLRGAVLADDLDPELQALTQRTCKELDAPIGAVSLMLDHIQLFRAAHGVPPDLEASRATDRDTSFCQFVVRDQALFEVNDARNDARVPQELVEKYGIASYLGAPVTLGGKAVGAMCAIDTVPRIFTARDRETIVRLAALATDRLELLAAQPRDRQRALHERAVQPAFSELRNRLTPVLGNISLMQVSLAELAAVQRLAQHVADTGDTSRLSILSRTGESVAELQESLDDLASEMRAIAGGIVALERASIASHAGCSLEDVIDAAVTLAHHRTKLVGGVRRPAATQVMLQAQRPVAITALSAALSELSDALVYERRASGMSILVTPGDRDVRVQIFAEVDATVFETIAEHLRLLLAETTVIVNANAYGLDLVYPAQTRRVVSPHGSRFHELDRSPA